MKKLFGTTNKCSSGGGLLYNLLTKDVKELNGIILSLVCISILFCAGLISYKITNSYALFSDSIVGAKTIEVTVVGKNLDESGANKPVLSENMIPVYYDEISGIWKKADSTNSNKTYKWYDYNNKMWANSVTVSETNRSTYLSASPGTEIPMDDILTMQVWIPRYKYKIFNYNENGTTYVSEQEIEITFEQGTETTGEISCVDSIAGTDGAASEVCKLKSDNSTCTDSTCNNKIYTHPAFTFGEEELTGMWVGKFETTGTISNIKIKPNLQSLRSEKVSSFETNIMAMNDSGNIYGFAETDDTHMMKNIEWGAVAYLSHSKYGTCTDGTCKEVNINNSSSYYTGRSGGSASASSSTAGTYKYNEIGTEGADGPSASTTGNIYGIYDMSGGSWEYVMGNIVSSDGTTMVSGYDSSNHSGYTGKVGSSSYTGVAYPEDKYIDKYSYGTSNSQRIKTKLGDAVKEVGTALKINWYSDYGYVVLSSSGPWFARGGIYNDGDSSGVFRSYGYIGHANIYYSARVVLVVS